MRRWLALISAGLLLPTFGWAADPAAPTARTRVQASLDRISQLDTKGPSLHAMIELNPDALTIADEVDKKPAPPRSVLWGEPIVVKDNIDTGDKMHRPER